MAQSAQQTETFSDDSFELGGQFEPGQVSGGLDLGPFTSHYQEIFADALEDGVITAEERQRLDVAADNLGIDRMRLNQLEQAMISAYEMHHRVKVVEKWERAPASLQPIEVSADNDEAKAMLLAQVERLTARVAELEAELRDARAHINVEVDVSSLEEPEVEASVDHLRARIRRDPRNPKLQRLLFSAFGQAGDLDGQYSAAQALSALGALEPEHSALLAAHGRDGLSAPRCALSAVHWQDELSHPELDIVTGNIFGLIAPAVLMGRVVTLRREKKLLGIDEDKRQDLTKTTLMAARATGWAAAVLGMPAPPVFVDPTHQSGFTHVPNMPPFTLIGRDALSGRSQVDHAFMAGRHLTYFRPEYFVKVLFPAVTELEDLFLAALLIGSPSLPIAAHLRTRVAPISDALSTMLDPSVKDGLRAQFKSFVADGGRTNLLRWSESVDKTACRAGLLLSGDLPGAVRMLEQEEGPAGPLSGDLLAFAASERYGTLRRHLGFALD